jgi:hypothetical protein
MPQRRLHDRLKTVVGSGMFHPVLDYAGNYPIHRAVSSIIFLS